MSQGRATEVLTKAWQEMPGSGLQVRIVNESGLPLTDGMTGALQTISVLHHETHKGEAYSAGSIFIEVADDAIADILIKPLGSTLHTTFFGAAAGDAEARLLENPGVGSSGTQIVPMNKNRVSANESSSEIWIGPTVTGEGSVLYAGVIPGGQKQQAIGGAVEERDEFILANGSLYIARIINKAGSAKTISIGCTFYEKEV